MRRQILIALAAMAGASPLSAQELPAAKPSSRELYVSCYLLLRDAAAITDASGKDLLYSPTQCAMYGVIAIANKEGAVPGDTRRFCLPRTAEAENPSRQMAAAYVDGYEAFAAAANSSPSLTAFVGTLIQKLPCPKQ